MRRRRTTGQAISNGSPAHHKRTTQSGLLPSGEDVITAKLTWAQVEEMRTRYTHGGVSRAALGKEYGVSPSTISATVRGKRWKGVATKVDQTTNSPSALWRFNPGRKGFVLDDMRGQKSKHQ
jgi:hypothetical protein